MAINMKTRLLLIFVLLGSAALAQDKYFYLAVDMNKPLSNTGWISDGTARGFRAGYRAFVTPNISAGLDIGSAAYDQYNPTETLELTNGAVTTDYFKYVYSHSAVVSGQYNFPLGEKEIFYTYAGLGFGANYNEYVRFYNIYDDREKAWGFLARPEAGVLVRFGQRRSIGAMAAVHYDFSTNRSKKFEYDNFSSIGFQVGLMFFD